MNLNWQFSKDKKRAAAVYPLMVSDNRAGTRAEIRLRADDTGRWEIDIVSEFGHTVRRGKYLEGLNGSVAMAKVIFDAVLNGQETPDDLRIARNAFAAELAEEEMEWEDA